MEGLLKEDGDGCHLKSTAKEPVPLSYKPELDVSPELGPKLASRYRQMVGILRWAVELGRVDIYYETAILSHYLVCPRKGHLEALYHIFAYLKSHQSFNLVFDPKGISLDQTAFASVKPAIGGIFTGT